MDAFGKVVAIFAGVILLFIAPLFYMAQKQDSISQLYVTQETIRLTDNIRMSGVLTQTMYKDYIERIDKTGNLYDLEILHAHKRVAPDYDETTDTVLSKIGSYFYNTYEDEIYQTFDEGKDYYFAQGDYISLKVVNRNKTMAGRITSYLSRGNNSEVSILVTYGGMIRDETE
jgi:ribosomal protein S17E